MLVVGGGGSYGAFDQFDMDGASIIAFLIGLVIVFIQQKCRSVFRTAPILPGLTRKCLFYFRYKR